MSCISYIKEGDLTPGLRTTLKNSDGTVIDLTSATSAKFRMISANGTVALIDATATIVAPATSGILEYAWNTGDTDDAGLYYIEWTVMYGAFPKTYPSSDYNFLAIIPRLPGP